eukprot:3207669-Amphidinium_carterae.1
MSLVSKSKQSFNKAGSYSKATPCSPLTNDVTIHFPNVFSQMIEWKCSSLLQNCGSTESKVSVCPAVWSITAMNAEAGLGTWT